MAEELEREIERRVEAMGFELVELERAGSKARPILRVRVDRVDAAPGAGITIDDCARISRSLEEWLDADASVAERYVLEVSSPGVERPLVRPRDFERFAGERIVVKGRAALPNGSRRIEGELLGLETDAGVERIRLRLDDGSEVDIPRADAARAHLVFRWQGRS